MSDPRFANVQRGDRVKILSNAGHVGRIVDVCGSFGPDGMLIYRVRIRNKPKNIYVQVREDQLEFLTGAHAAAPPAADASAPPSTADQ